jgi:hypothetical protein
MLTGQTKEGSSNDFVCDSVSELTWRKWVKFQSSSGNRSYIWNAHAANFSTVSPKPAFCNSYAVLNKEMYPVSLSNCKNGRKQHFGFATGYWIWDSTTHTSNNSTTHTSNNFSLRHQIYRDLGAQRISNLRGTGTKISESKRMKLEAIHSPLSTAVSLLWTFNPKFLKTLCIYRWFSKERV